MRTFRWFKLVLRDTGVVGAEELARWRSAGSEWETSKASRAEFCAAQRTVMSKEVDLIVNRAGVMVAPRRQNGFGGRATAW